MGLGSQRALSLLQGPWRTCDLPRWRSVSPSSKQPNTPPPLFLLPLSGRRLFPPNKDARLDCVSKYKKSGVTLRRVILVAVALCRQLPVSTRKRLPLYLPRGPSSCRTFTIETLFQGCLAIAFCALPRVSCRVVTGSLRHLGGGAAAAVCLACARGGKGAWPRLLSSYWLAGFFDVGPLLARSLAFSLPWRVDLTNACVREAGAPW